jgi:hypothetical protein
LELWLDGQAGRTYALQTSTNLVHWIAMSTNTPATNSVRYVVPVISSSPTFYRGKLIQP